MTGSIVRATAPAADGSAGFGLTVTDAATGSSTLAMDGSLIDANHEAGIAVAGSQLTVEHSVIRATEPKAADGTRGQGISGQRGLVIDQPSQITVRASVLEQNHLYALVVLGSEAEIEASTLHDTLPPPDLEAGYGLGGLYYEGSRSSVAMRGCVVERMIAAGVLIEGSDAVIEATAIHDVTAQPNRGWFGRGIGVQSDGATGEGATLQLRDSALERNVESALIVLGASAVVERCSLASTAVRPVDQAAGDAVLVYSLDRPASLEARDNRVTLNARAGIVNVGAHAVLGGNWLECNPIDLVDDSGLAGPADFVDLGGNVCSCAGTTYPCQAKSAVIEPPEPADPGQP
jgi:hypothetical protein